MEERKRFAYAITLLAAGLCGRHLSGSCLKWREGLSSRENLSKARNGFRRIARLPG
jgi:hypothetical protein